jgi:hypothetical protein
LRYQEFQSGADTDYYLTPKEKLTQQVVTIWQMMASDCPATAQ